MASVFAITTVTDKLKAETGSATTVFTVTNTTSRPLRGVAKLKPMGNTESAWIKIDGETERDFPAGGTHQFTVGFNKPKPPQPPTVTQPAESFPFRFDAISAANPDEDFTEGPIVTVEIPEQKVEEKKPFPWWIAAVAAAVLLVIGGVVLWLVLRSTDVEVPDVTTKTYAEAEKELKDRGFTVTKVEETKPNTPPDKLDTVFKQEPEGKTKAAQNSTVKLSVPAATKVPPLGGKCAVEAIELLVSSELMPGELVGDKNKIQTCDRRVGTTNPAANAPIAKGSQVTMNFPCNPAVEICIRFPFKDLTTVPNFRINPDVMRRLQISPTP